MLLSAVPSSALQDIQIDVELRFLAVLAWIALQEF
jgi:hypothetical protein